MDYLIELDQNLFLWIQHHLRNHLFDLPVAILRDKHTWLPLYVFLISYLAFWRKTKILKILLFVAMIVGFSDQLSSNFLKKRVKRIRPCQETSLLQYYKPVLGCSGGYSFPSSHASNHAALGVFLFFVLGAPSSNWRYGLLAWPFLIGFAQLYIGVHYPLDLLGGWLMGGLLGSLMYLIYTKTGQGHQRV
ncbi:MAG: phosphatase PAP2 family protein [Saprospiraceae bacterium]|nr:phosphatase PAP2 family protein [Saprospiraceae bacterium]